MTVSEIDFDLAVVGSGAAGFAAAIRAVGLGKRVVMVEAGTVGGTCVNTGCVPSKALLAAASARRVAMEAARFPGIGATVPAVDMRRLIDGKDRLVEDMRADKYVRLAADYGWEIRRGRASFSGTRGDPLLRLVDAGGAASTVRAERYLVATGSAPWAAPIDGLADVGFLTSETAMGLRAVPSSLLVIGGGYVAMEQAQLFARLGSEVTMLVRTRLASTGEPEAGEAVRAAFAEEGITVVSRAVPVKARRDDRGGIEVTATLAGTTQEFRAEHLLVATGRRPATDGLNLPAVGVATGSRGEVEVDGFLRTGNPRIWAAGDATGHHQFVYVAAAQGGLAVDNMFTGTESRVDYRGLPRVVFTDPAVATVGMTESEAVSSGIRCRCRILPLENVPRALVDRDTRGLVKMVADADTGRIVGITAVAAGAGELAAAGGYILAAGLTVDQVARTWSPYLTMAEALRIAALSFETDVTRLSCCAA